MADYFEPWIGENYKEGFGGKTVLVVGAQHWCEGNARWKCGVDDPTDCLQKHDADCPVWKQENLCPVKACGKWEEYCKQKKSRYLHCETRISVYDHIFNKGVIKRASVFRLTYEALKKLFPKEDFSRKKFEKLIEIDKKDYWNRIVFTNYIQHYTAYQEGGALDVDELGKTKKADKQNLESCMKLFKDGEPDFIVVLKEEEVLNRIKETLDGYMLFEIQTKPNCFYVLGRCSDELKAYNDDILDDFIKYYANNWGDVSSEDSRKIETLVMFVLPRYIAKRKKNALRKQVVDAIIDSYNKEEEQKEILRKKYYKGNDFSDDTLRKASGNISKEDVKQSVKSMFDDFLKICKISY